MLTDGLGHPGVPAVWGSRSLSGAACRGLEVRGGGEAAAREEGARAPVLPPPGKSFYHRAQPLPPQNQPGKEGRFAGAEGWGPEKQTSAGEVAVLTRSLLQALPLALALHLLELRQRAQDSYSSWRGSPAFVAHLTGRAGRRSDSPLTAWSAAGRGSPSARKDGVWECVVAVGRRVGGERAHFTFKPSCSTPAFSVCVGRGKTQKTGCHWRSRTP